MNIYYDITAKKEISMISQYNVKIFEAVISRISNKILAAILKNALCTAKIKSNIHWIYHGRGCLAGRFLLTCFVQAFLPATSHKIFAGVRTMYFYLTFLFRARPINQNDLR